VTYVSKGDEYKRIDSRQLKRFMRVPGFSQSITTSQAEGMNRRILTASWQPETRIVYDAILEGYTSMDQLPVATGLTTQQINSALADLSSKGYIKEAEVAPVEKSL